VIQKAADAPLGISLCSDTVSGCSTSVQVVSYVAHTRFTAECLDVHFVYESYLMEDYRRWFSNRVSYSSTRSGTADDLSLPERDSSNCLEMQRHVEFRYGELYT
jgi:hypothetical protein